MKKSLMALGVVILLSAAAMAVVALRIRVSGESTDATSTSAILSITHIDTATSNITVNPGEQVTVRVAAEGIQKVAGMQFRLEFDESVVEILKGGLVQGQLPSGFLFHFNVNNSEGYVDIIIASARPADVADMAIADITFHVAGSPGEVSPLSFKVVLAGDASLPVQAVPITAVDGIITVGGRE